MQFEDKVKTGVVIFLDALGVKNLGITKSLEFLEKREKFIEGVKIIRDKRSNQFKNKLNVVLPEPEIALFQDSLIFCFEKAEKTDFSFLFSAGQMLVDAINYAIGLKLFFRGSISYGDYIFTTSENNVTIIGPAIDDAHDYCEKADWIGVMLTPDCEKKYISDLMLIAEKENRPLEVIIEYYRFLFVQYSIPFRKHNIIIEKEFLTKHFAVSWPQLSYSIEKKGDDKILNTLLEESNRPENFANKSKYENSINFASWYKNYMFIPESDC